jgi:hypothetical protein
MTQRRPKKVEDRTHAFGWALREVMAAPNVQARSQKQLSDKLKKAGYDVSQQTVSDYVRSRVVDGEVRPRVLVPPEFLLMLDGAFKLTDAQWEKLTNGWAAIMPEDRRAAYRRICAVLAHLEERQDGRG